MQASVAILVVGLWVQGVAAVEGKDRCKAHTDCGDLEVCNQGTCETAVNRTYIVTVVKAEMREKRTTAPHKGKTWDALGGAPDPRVHVHFPDINTVAFVVSGVRDEHDPVWNKASKITVTAAGQEIYFCFYDQDSSNHDPMSTVLSGESNCIGNDNIVDFIRAGVVNAKTDADVKSFQATIKRK